MLKRTTILTAVRCLSDDGQDASVPMLTTLALKSTSMEPSRTNAKSDKRNDKSIKRTNINDVLMTYR
jgi:hypothetical protein